MTDRAKPQAGNWGMVGHEWAVDLLREHLTRDSLRHAYLFTGPSGVGRRTLALRLVQALNCPTPAGPGEPCGHCRTCRQIEAMQYPDLAVIQAEEEGAVLPIGAVRPVCQNLVLTPYQSLYRVALFLRFQEANQNAANALLKTLEEAPPHAILLLTAEDAEGLLPTIVSRCMVIRLRPLPLEKVENALKERGLKDERANLLAHLSAGRPGRAFRYLDDTEGLRFRQMRLEDLRRLLTASRVEKFSYAGKISERKKEAEERLRDTLVIWQTYWHDVLLSASAASAPLVNIDRADEIRSLAGRLGLAQARRMVKGMGTAIEMLEKNVNPRLLVEVTLLDWPK